MCQEPTELLWIGCLTGLILILTFRFDTLSQAPTRTHVEQWQFHTWWMEQSSSFVWYQPFQLHLLHQDLQLDKLLHNCEEDSRSKRRRKELCPSRDQQWWIYLLLLRQVLSPHQFRLHQKVQGCRQLRGRPTAGWVLNQAHSTQRRRLKCDSRIHTLAGWWKSSGETRLIKNKKIQKIPTILGLEPGTTKRNTLREKPLAKTVHLGQDCEANLRCVKNHLWQTAGQLFRETEKLVSGQTESRWHKRDWFQDLRLMSTSLLHSRAYQCFIAEAHAFSDSVLCLGKMGGDLVESWKSKNSMAFGQQLFQGFEANWWTTYGTRLEDFSRTHCNGIPQSSSTDDGRITVWTRELHWIGASSMSMFNDIVWDAKGNDEICENNSKTIKQFARRIPRGHWSFPRPGFEKERYGTYDYKPDGSWDRTAQKMLLTFAETNHPAFRGASVWGERRFKEEVERSQYTFMAAPKALSCFSDWVISVNQLSIYEAVTDMIEEWTVGQRAVGKPKAPGQLDKVEILTQPPLA